MLANLKPSIRLEMYMAGFCCSMLATVALGGWWVSQRQAIAGENFPSANPHNTVEARQSKELPREASRQSRTAKSGADGTYQSAIARMLF